MTSAREPWRTYADPVVLDPALSYDDRRRSGRELRVEVPFDVALDVSALPVDRAWTGAAVAEAVTASPTSGLVVWLSGRGDLPAIGAVADGRLAMCDLTDVDEALPGPWEADVMAMALSAAVAGKRSKGRSLAEAVASGYREGVAAIAGAPLHAVDAAAREAAAGRAAGVHESYVASFEGAEKLLVRTPASEAAAELDPAAVAAHWQAPVAGVLDDALREFAQYRETVDEPAASLMSGYRMIDALGAEDGRVMVLLAREASGKGRRDVVLVEGSPVTPSPLEPALGAWRQGSDVQRVLEARERLPLASASLLGWSTSRDGAVARAWQRPRLAPKPMSSDASRKRARSAGFVLGLLHARTGDAVALAGYLGGSDRFPVAVADAVAAVSG